MSHPEGTLYGPPAMEFFAELKRADPGNKTCVDCNANNPLWASLSYGSCARAPVPAP